MGLVTKPGACVGLDLDDLPGLTLEGSIMVGLGLGLDTNAGIVGDELSLGWAWGLGSRAHPLVLPVRPGL